MASYTINKYRVALRQIAGGAVDPVKIAQEALAKSQLQSEDLTGRKFGLLTVLSKGPTMPDGTKHTAGTWFCACACGTQKLVKTSRLKGGIVKSCGCLQSKPKRKRKYQHGYGPAVDAFYDEPVE
jgi:hypothetical protein